MPKPIRTLAAAALVLGIAHAISAQTSAYTSTMTFDVASIRQSNPDPNGFTVRGGFSPINSSHFLLENNDLWNLVLWAYPVNPHQIVGLDRLPPELRRATFNVEARADEAADARLAQLPEDQRVLEQQHMIQVMLAERFNLKVHWETRNSATYDLVVAKKGKLQTTGAPPTAQELKDWGDRGVPPIYQRGDSRYGFEYIAHAATMSDLAQLLTEQFGASVNDKTGLTGKYYFHLKTYQVQPSERSIDESNPWPPLETAIYDDLGLKLVRSYGPVKFLVVDHVEMPSAN